MKNDIGLQAQELFHSQGMRSLRGDLALALRAAAHHGLGEGVCNHFSVVVPQRPEWFLLNPRGLHWSEVQGHDIVLVDAWGRVLAGNHAVEPTAMCIHGRVAADADYNGLALDEGEGERIALAMGGADVVFLGNHGVIVCGERMDHAYDDLYYLERACMAQVIAMSTGRALQPVAPELAARVAAQTLGERLQSELFFRS